MLSGADLVQWPCHMFCKHLQNVCQLSLFDSNWKSSVKNTFRKLYFWLIVQKDLFWFFKALIKNGVQRFLLTYASRIYKLLYSLRIWNFFSSTKAKTQEMKFCNNSNTLFALLLNSLLLQFTLQQLKNTLCTTFELTKGQ